MITIPSAIASLLRFRLGLIKSGPLTNREIEKLNAFLLSDGGLENAMDVSTLDGFLCAVLSGPNAYRQAGVYTGRTARACTEHACSWPAGQSKQPQRGAGDSGH